jgi:hypothetical protein
VVIWGRSLKIILDTQFPAIFELLADAACDLDADYTQSNLAVEKVERCVDTFAGSNVIRGAVQGEKDHSMTRKSKISTAASRRP